MNRTSQGGAQTTGNHILDALLRERPALVTHVEATQPNRRMEMCVEGQPARYVYFPVRTTLVSVVLMSNGATNEVLSIGSEGMVGIGAWLGLARHTETVLQESSGEVMRVRADVFIRLMNGQRNCRVLLNHLAAYVLRAQSQLIACNASHSAEQRLCRWLLARLDRRDAPIRVSQMALGEALGVRRQTVGEIALQLQRERVLAYRRGQIQVLDRTRLEADACECLGILRRSYRRLVEPKLAR